jgi:hypothetical protein
MDTDGIWHFDLGAALSLSISLDGIEFTGFELAPPGWEPR